jgi:hypothetical protein
VNADDELDACGAALVDDDDDVTSDDDIDAVVLFADIDPKDHRAVLARAIEYEELFGAP